MKIFVRLEEWLLAILMIVICGVTMANVLSRYFLNVSLSMTEELTTNLFAYAIFIGASLLAREKGHLGFSLLTDYLPPKLQIIIAILIGCLTTVFFAVLFWFGLEMVMQQYEYQQKTPALGLDEWIMGLAVPLGSFLCVLRFWEGCILEIKTIRGRMKS
ncbi:TRAP transporter small permease [Peribacillus asahii]|uniref:C4-dicarboxylate transport system permease small protein n=1 Tax=Peribacillus asahii TaxID=228899 RepID=A0A3Q9RR37_9BACI|nr:TRAP transporter small permease [Peribacillus asahii]AZV45538.1 C4-dicarboxylate transport system permease small protein [Peribacillus asahii]USK85102.1 TRAP transporter small permease [Peribacillus asahii]